MGRKGEPFSLNGKNYVLGPNGTYVDERRLKQMAVTNENIHNIKKHFGGSVDDDQVDSLSLRRSKFFNGKFPCPALISALEMVLKKKKMFKKPIVNHYRKSLTGFEPTEEFHVQLILSLYMEAYYPGERYRVDLAGLNISKTQRGQSKLVNKDRGWHDFEVPRPSGDYNGLTMELKRFHNSKGHKTNLICTRGERKGQWMTDHFEEQHQNNLYMRECGRASGFVIGAANCLEVVDCYFSKDFDRMNEIMIV